MNNHNETADLLNPPCAGARNYYYEKCPRCGATVDDACLDDAAYEAQYPGARQPLPNGVFSMPSESETAPRPLWPGWNYMARWLAIYLAVGGFGGFATIIVALWLKAMS